ncbi:PhzF family phenazine biosynthesis protein [Umezawaea endophytica]|uniref:PhzF family phenazine biosynthesis protein n=1 Tax=Umezawaea endophytica TaxID=1654476 RepID=A0A9X2ZYS9_9PSEU|nr:PhzF family phenazine biosynthesis protein [Umezawaea endophytica]MCS7476744.1 PhzF family phenazine biosynthesis protein [Umezawaea endophytica]
MIDYEVVDMFADRPLTGCALGVVADAAGLSDPAMAAVAREIGTSETAFVLPPTAPAATHRVRVFTPHGESPFGGHSAVGTACALVRAGTLPEGRVVQQCGDRLLPVDATARTAELTATGPLETTPFDAADLAAACDLPTDELTALAAAAGFGPAFHYLPAHSSSLQLAGAHPERDAWNDRADLFAFTWDQAARTARARMFAPGYRMPEDPACASAALGLGVWLVSVGWLPTTDGRHRYRVRQGVEMGRPSTLDCRVDVEDGRVVEAAVSGVVLPAAHGRMVSPDPAAVPA